MGVVVSGQPASASSIRILFLISIVLCLLTRSGLCHFRDHYSLYINIIIRIPPSSRLLQCDHCEPFEAVSYQPPSRDRIIQ